MKISPRLILTLAFALAMSFSFTACSSSDESSSDAGMEGTRDTTARSTSKEWRKDGDATTRKSMDSGVGAGAGAGAGGGRRDTGSMQAGGMSKASLALPTGRRETSALLLEKVVPAEVIVGQPYTYDLRVTNLTSGVLENVMVSDAVQGAFAMTSSNPAAVAGSGGNMNWNLGSLQPGATKTVRVSGSATGSGDIIGCASATYNTSICLTTRATKPALQLKKSGPAEVLACDSVPYTFEVTNNGTGMARNVKITDNLPSGWTTTDGRNSFAINVGNLAAGQTRRFSVNVKPGGKGRVTNTATATGDGGLSADSNPVVTNVTRPELAITKSGPAKVFIGRNIKYTLAVTNKGDGVAKNAIVEDMMPAGATFVSASDNGRATGNKVAWQLGTMAPGASKTLTLTVKAAGAGTLRNTASAKAYCAAAVSASASTNVTGIPAILLEVVDIEDPIAVGGEVTYRITATNQGSAPDTNIRIGCGLENTMQFVSGGGATSLNSAGTTGSTVVFQPLATLAPKAKAVWTVRVKAVSQGDVRFKVSMTSDQLSRPVEETEATNFYQ